MELCKYPRPPIDTGWGFHDSAGTDAKVRDPAAYARYLRQDLGITWFKALVSGQNKTDLARVFTQEGIEVVVRLYAPQPHPGYVVSVADVRAYVEAGVHYFEWGNEPNLVAEWNRASWDEGARVDKVCEQFLRNADAIRRGEGIPLLPALSPGGDYPHRDWYRTMFDWFRLHGHLVSLEGAALAVHNRPLAPWTFQEYEWIDDLVRTYVGRSLPLLGTEAGYEVGWAQDPTWTPITPQMHADLNLEILRGFRERRWRDALFCQCLWLVDNFGHRDFAEAAWHNNQQWAKGGNLPAVDALRHEWASHPFVRQLGPAIPRRIETPGVTYHDWYQTDHHSSREGQPVKSIIIHDTKGSLAAALAWWLSAENPYNSSAHDLVDVAGHVWRCVTYDLAAHHAKVLNPTTIGVELECPAKPLSPLWPEAQLAAAAAHVRELARVFGIPRTEVKRHSDIADTDDPRNLDWQAFLDRVFEVPTGGEDVEELIRKAAYEALKVPWNPVAALARTARQNDLGMPLTPERDITIAGVTYRFQVFALGVVWARLGNWGDCKVVK